MPYEERDEESGKLTKSYADQDFIDAVEANEPASTGDVAESVGCSLDTARLRLRKLVDKDRIHEKSLGRQYAYTRPPE